MQGKVWSYQTVRCCAVLRTQLPSLLPLLRLLSAQQQQQQCAASHLLQVLSYLRPQRAALL